MDIRKALLEPKLKTEEVTLPRLGIKVTVMEMNAQRLDDYESLVYPLDEKFQVQVDTDHMSAKIAVFSVVDDKGELIFKPDDVLALSKTYGKDLKVIADAGSRLSGLFSPGVVEKN